jgi:ribulose-phosphate 3-epimerase
LKIAASVLSSDFSKFGEEIKKLSISGVDMIHFDVMDGCFVPEISFGAGVIKSVRHCTFLPFEVHLMVSRPISFVNSLVNAGADIIIFHVESKSEILETIEKIKKSGKKAGISIKPGTSAESIFEYLPIVDVVLVMTVEPGFGGQKFIENQIEKIGILKEKIDFCGFKTLIEVDGGINAQNVSICSSLGVDICVAGTYILNSSNMENAISSLKDSNFHQKYRRRASCFC